MLEQQRRENKTWNIHQHYIVETQIIGTSFVTKGNNISKAQNIFQHFIRFDQSSKSSKSFFQRNTFHNTRKLNLQNDSSHDGHRHSSSAGLSKLSDKIAPIGPMIFSCIFDPFEMVKLKGIVGHANSKRNNLWKRKTSLERSLIFRFDVVLFVMQS